ncbi:MAG: sterol desaturase family protein [Bacteroidetes bacterium]|nr:MAG: sterol desaturase family protein [Bacteroidota bacterium]
MEIFTLYALAVLTTLLLIESLWAWRKKRQVYNLRESLANGFIFLGNQLLKPLKIAWSFWVFQWLEPFALFDIPQAGWGLAAAFVITDFLYYWQHRCSHEWRWLWTLHNVHHSSPWMNFSTAIRINWLTGFVSPLFFFPAILLGFTPLQVTLCLVLNLLYQLFLHTELVGRIPLIEGWLNTPSAHRVHHGSNARYIDKNYGGVLMLWDRLFGTYEREVEPVKYGVTTGFMGHNPIKLLFGPLWNYLRGNFEREKKLMELKSSEWPPAPDE